MGVVMKAENSRNKRTTPYNTQSLKAADSSPQRQLLLTQIRLKSPNSSKVWKIATLSLHSSPFPKNFSKTNQFIHLNHLQNFYKYFFFFFWLIYFSISKIFFCSICLLFNETTNTRLWRLRTCANIERQ